MGNKKVLLFDIIKLSITYTFIWLILSGGVYDLFSIFFILCFSIITPFVFSLNFSSFNIKRFMDLLFYFFLNSLKGGFLVANLAIKKNLKLKPYIYKMSLKTKTPFASSMLANIYSLMPGTVTMGLYDQELTLHIIDISLFNEKALNIIEEKIILAFEDGGLR